MTKRILITLLFISLVFAGEEWVYLNNPTRINIDRTIKTRNGEKFIDLEYLDFSETQRERKVSMMFVITMDGKLILGREVSPSIFSSFEGRIKKMPHSTLVTADGEIQRVLAAGEITIQHGKILKVNNSSGHFPSGPEVISVIDQTLEKYKDIFYPEYSGAEDVSSSSPSLIFKGN